MSDQHSGRDGMGGFLRFATTIIIGIAIDAGALALLLALTPIGPFFGRSISILAAIIIVWLAGETVRSAASGPNPTGRIFRRTVLVISSLLNYALYATVLTALPFLQPLAALAMASVAAMAFSFFGYWRFLVRR